MRNGVRENEIDNVSLRERQLSALFWVTGFRGDQRDTAHDVDKITM